MINLLDYIRIIDAILWKLKILKYRLFFQIVFALDADWFATWRTFSTKKLREECGKICVLFQLSQQLISLRTLHSAFHFTQLEYSAAHTAVHRSPFLTYFPNSIPDAIDFIFWKFCFSQNIFFSQNILLLSKQIFLFCTPINETQERSKNRLHCCRQLPNVTL